jgi:hypothetical protein
MTVINNTLAKASAEFRKYLPDLGSQRFIQAKEQNAYQYSETFQTDRNPPWLYKLTEAWEKLYQTPFEGITNNGMTVALLLYSSFHCSRF